MGLTEYFKAAAADSISGIEAPVDTMEQQAEHCQAEMIQGGGGKRDGEEREKKKRTKEMRGQGAGGKGRKQDEDRNSRVEEMMRRRGGRGGKKRKGISKERWGRKQKACEEM